MTQIQNHTLHLHSPKFLNNVATKLLSVIAVSLAITLNTYAQDAKTKARDLATKAIELEDKGQLDEALPLLNEAEKLDPTDYVYAFEKAYCYRQKKDYKSGIAEMNRVMDYNGMKPEGYEMLGNLYDMDGDSLMALKTYTGGLKKFPRSGSLYLESGNIYLIRHQYDEAIPYYEKGIEVDPTYPTNYYRAAQIFTLSQQAIWGMIYGELFMNLERGSDRTAEISKTLYETYKANIIIKSKDSMSVTFCNSHSMNIEDLAGKKKKKEMRLPFSMVYEPLILMSLLPTDGVSTESLCQMRTKFLHRYYETGDNKKYPNVLFGYQHKVDEAGHMDAYNHWILMKGDEEAFSTWRNAHAKQWDDFIEWFGKNKIDISTENEFLRTKA